MRPRVTPRPSLRRRRPSRPSGESHTFSGGTTALSASPGKPCPRPPPTSCSGPLHAVRREPVLRCVVRVRLGLVVRVDAAIRRASVRASCAYARTGSCASRQEQQWEHYPTSYLAQRQHEALFDGYHHGRRYAGRRAAAWRRERAQRRASAWLLLVPKRKGEVTASRRPLLGRSERKCAGIVASRDVRSMTVDLTGHVLGHKSAL